ncbi:tripartite motif-containing protein 16-like isoform X2 [Lepisosteus oculatus]|uniref:tripartite motif-containing protein 16-like isoform X2 n=1 Tax=Lepisosteus oculatus TaxID=7918 RepID=UPI003711CA20
MAEASISVAQDQLSCPVCLDILKDPVSLPCGHSYCVGCIKSCWDLDDQIGIYSCPQCRQTFTPRPVLGRNIMLAEVVEKLKETGLSGPPAPSPAGPGDVLCDVCTGRQVRAVKSCLVCLASYCQTHLQPHYEAPAFRRHKLVDVVKRLDAAVCPDHIRLLESFCQTDGEFICSLCTMGKHRGHDTVSAAAERTKKQKQLGATQRQTQQRLQEREKELQELRQAVDSLRSSAHTAVQDTDRIFTELIRSIERTRSELTQLIRAQERAAVSQAEGLLERLEQKIAELRRRDAELSQLSHTEDHIHFLQNFQSVCVPPGAGDSTSIPVGPHFSPEAVRRAVSGLKEQLENFCKEESVKISRTVSEVYSLQTPEHRTRAKLLHYACRLTLDPNTAHRHLRLSEGNRRVTWSREPQQYPDHPERFDSEFQVLCREGLSGTRCYWEVEWSGGWVYIGVTYKGLSRKGEGVDCHLGHNVKSWSLCCSGYSWSFRHNNEETAVPVLPSSRIGVYVDHRAGTLEFYSVSGDTVTLLYRVQTSFTEPLYPGFRFGNRGDSVTLSHLQVSFVLGEKQELQQFRLFSSLRGMKCDSTLSLDSKPTAHRVIYIPPPKISIEEPK